MKNQKSKKSQRKIQPRKEKRYFSEDARKAIVDEIENGLSIAEAHRKYKVSKVSIHKWIRKYSDKYSPPLVTVVEHESDSQKNKILTSELSQVYESLGRSQAENMLLQKIIELAGEHFEIDLKKNFENKHLPSSINTKKTTK